MSVPESTADETPLEQLKARLERIRERRSLQIQSNMFLVFTLRSGETHYHGVWSGEPAQSRRTTPPLCSGRARTTAGDLPPPLGALCPRKGYPSGKDERLASHPGELRRLSAVCMRPQFSTWVLGGPPLAA